MLKLVIVEDDPAQMEVVCAWLSETYELATFTSAESFLEALPGLKPNLLMLDWELPGKSGLDILVSVRESGLQAPVMFVTQRDEEANIVGALNAGADDYMIKPVREFELKARLAALARRAPVEQSEYIDIANIRLHLNKEVIDVDGNPLDLTHKEYAVARKLLENMNAIVSRDQLLEEVWQTSSMMNTRTVDVHVSKVRRLLNINPEMGYRIKTIYNHGYRFEKLTED